MAAVTADPQLRLVENQLDDDEELAAQLDEWLAAKEALVAPRKRYALVNDQVKATLAELEEGEYRCGRFAITIAHSESRKVEFERTSSKRISIKLFADDE
jgi:hypothetical protein